MKSAAVILLSVLLIGCATPIVKKPAFPEPPELLMRKPADLKQL